jgi:hypothetical protein
MVLFLIFLFFVLFVVAIVGTLAFVLAFVGAIRTRVPYLHVPSKIVPEIMKALALTQNVIIYDLGCGDTKVLRQILENNPTANGVGVEISPLPYTIAYVWNFFSPQPRLKIIYKNFFDVLVGDATHVFLYLFPEPMEKLLPKLSQELRPGTRVVSCDFEFKSKKAVEIIQVKTSKNRTHKLFLYTF